MNKIDVWSLKRPVFTGLSFRVEDNSNPNVSLELHFDGPTMTKMLEIGTLTQQKVEYYKPVPNEETPGMPFADGREIPFNEESMSLACAMHVLQKEPVYSVEEFLILFETMTEGMLPVIGRIKQLTEKFVSQVENPTGAVIIP